MLLGTLNQTLTYEDTNGTLQPAPSVTCTVHRAGATVRNTVVHTAGSGKVIDVEGFNTVKANDVLIHDINSGTTMTVTAVDYANRRITVTLSGGVTFTAGERLLVSDATVYNYVDEHALTKAADNTLTTDSNGFISTYSKLGQVDILVSASGVYSSDWIMSDVQVQQLYMYTPAHFGAQGLSAENEILQQAITMLDAYGIQTLWLDKFYIHDTALSIPSGFELRGMNRDQTGLIFNGAAGSAYSLSGPSITFKDFKMNGAGGSAAPMVAVNQTEFTVDNVEVIGCAEAFNCSSANAYFRYTDISATSKGITISGNSSRIEGCIITTTNAGSECVTYVPSGANLLNAYIGGGTVLTANNTGSKAIYSAGTASYDVELTVAGVMVQAGDVDLDYTKLQVLGLRAAATDILIDATTATQMAGTINDDVVLQDSNGTPADTPPANSCPVRFDPGTGKLWAHDGTSWISTTIGRPSQDFDYANMFSTSTITNTITTGGVFEKLGGASWFNGGSSTDFDMTVDNRIKYTGSTYGKRFHFVASLDVRGSTGTPEDIRFRPYVYDDSAGSGSTNANYEKDVYSSANNGNVVITGHCYLEENDYLEIWCTRATTGQTVIVDHVNIILQEVNST